MRQAARDLGPDDRHAARLTGQLDYAQDDRVAGADGDAVDQEFAQLRDDARQPMHGVVRTLGVDVGSVSTDLAVLDAAGLERAGVDLARTC